MKYFKDSNNSIYAYAQDGSEDEFIKDALVAITESEAMEIVNPQPTNSQLLSKELSELSIVYKNDIYDLNASYLAAIVSEGPSEIAKQQIVREQINQRKSQYVSDIANAKEKYPV